MFKFLSFFKFCLLVRCDNSVDLRLVWRCFFVIVLLVVVFRRLRLFVVLLISDEMVKVLLVLFVKLVSLIWFVLEFN